MKDYQSLCHGRWDCKYHVVFRCLSRSAERVCGGFGVGYIKAKSAISIARNLMGGARNFTGENFWARGYFVSTVGLDQKTVREYIRDRDKENEPLEQLNMDLQSQSPFTGFMNRPFEGLTGIGPGSAGDHLTTHIHKYGYVWKWDARNSRPTSLKSALSAQSYAIFPAYDHQTGRESKPFPTRHASPKTAAPTVEADFAEVGPLRAELRDLSSLRSPNRPRIKAFSHSSRFAQNRSADR